MQHSGLILADRKMVSHIADEPEGAQNSVKDVAPNEIVRRRSFQKSAEVGSGRPDNFISPTTKQKVWKAWKAGIPPRGSRGKVWPPSSEPSELGEEDENALSASIGQLGSNETQEGASSRLFKNRAKTCGQSLTSPPESARGEGKKKVWKPPPKVDKQHLPPAFRSQLTKPRTVYTESAKWNPNASYYALEIPEHFVTPSGVKKESLQWPQNSDDIISPLLDGSPKVLPAGRSPISFKPLPKIIQWPQQRSEKQTRVPVKTRKAEFEQLQIRGIVEGAYTKYPERYPLRTLRKRPSFRGGEDEDLDVVDIFDDEDSQGRAFCGDSSLDSGYDYISSYEQSFGGGRRMVDKRTSYRIRYNGPMNSLPPVPDLDDRFLPSSIPKDLSPSRPNRFVDAAPSRPSRPGSFFDDDDPYGEITRPDVWITPMGETADADQMWKVRRVWAKENADEDKDEHDVNNEDLYTKIKNLVGAQHSPKDDLPKIPRRNWNVKKIVEINGEVDESLPEESVHDDEIEQRVEAIAAEARIEQAERERACEEYKKEKEESKKSASAGETEPRAPPAPREIEPAPVPAVQASPTNPPQSPTKTEGFQDNGPDIVLWWRRDDAREKEARVHASSS
jgi:hypothetical protein